MNAALYELRYAKEDTRNSKVPEGNARMHDPRKGFSTANHVFLPCFLCIIRIDADCRFQLIIVLSIIVLRPSTLAETGCVLLLSEVRKVFLAKLHFPRGNGI